MIRCGMHLSPPPEGCLSLPAPYKETRCPTTVWKPSPLRANIVASVAMPRRHSSKRRVVSNGSVAIRPLCRFEAAGDVKWSMNGLACVIHTMRISMVGLGKVVRNAVISGRHAITKPMRRTPSIGQNIEGWDVNEVQIPGTKIEL